MLFALHPICFCFYSIVYRDIKPENIGFDIRGDVKVFDFGLCKPLSERLKAAQGYGYRLTGRAGSLPYMAPEVIRMETYDTKCDVFSFSMLLWEMLVLKQAFKGCTPQEFVERVVMDKERLPVPKTIPILTRLMIPEAWDDDPRNRPDMKRIAILIRGDLNDLTSDETVLHRTQHMEERSQASHAQSDDELSISEKSETSFDSALQEHVDELKED
jgi:serine/threonine protein kinase